MKRITTLAFAVLAASFAHGQVTLYDNLGDLSYTTGYVDFDGGSNYYGAGVNYGNQVGQVFTSSVTGSMTYIEDYLVGVDANGVDADGAYVALFNFSGGVVGAEVGDEQVSINATNDGLDPNLGPTYYRYDISADVDIAGLVAGNQYLAVLQMQGGDNGYLLVNGDGSPDTFVRNLSSFGYPGLWGTNTWTELSTINSSYPSGDSLMMIQGVSSTPEPCSIAALGLGAIALIRRRRAAK